MEDKVKAVQNALDALDQAVSDLSSDAPTPAVPAVDPVWESVQVALTAGGWVSPDAVASEEASDEPAEAPAEPTN